MKSRGSFQLSLLIGLCLVSGQVCAQKAPKRAPDVHWEPSPPEVVTAMLRLADVKNHDIVYDLGCGDGRIVIAAARDFGARGVGIDIDPQRITESQQNARQAGVASRVEFREEDLFEADFHDATVVMLFLWPSLNLKLRPILMRQLRPGTRIVSYIHDMADWAPEKETSVNGRPIYLWTIASGRQAHYGRDAVQLSSPLCARNGLVSVAKLHLGTCSEAPGRGESSRGRQPISANLNHVVFTDLDLVLDFDLDLDFDRDVFRPGTFSTAS